MASAEDLSKQAEQLFREKRFQDIISLLTDEELQKNNNALMYFWRARAHAALEQNDLYFAYIKKANDIDPKLAEKFLQQGRLFVESKETNKAMEEYNNAVLANSTFPDAYNSRGVLLQDLKDYDNAMKDYDQAIALENSFAEAYSNRGILKSEKKEFNSAKDDFDRAIQLNDAYANAYIGRGVLWSDNKEFERAVEDYTTAIELEKKNPDIYFNRGLALTDLKRYDDAIKDFGEAISINKEDVEFYYSRGIAYRGKKQYDKAIEDFSTAVSANKNYVNAYYNRALTNEDLGNYETAIEDYRRVVELTNNSNVYLTKVAKAQIEELKKKLANPWYNDIDELVKKIKQLLLFEEPCLTHYTSLSGASAMILSNSPLRLSEGAFLNDTSEGRELFKYLLFSTADKTSDETFAESFVERPFIGSFVAEGKNNDLTLWRMYGKEAQTEAKGCALTIYRDLFIRALNEVLELNLSETKTANSSAGEVQFTFYKVAYRGADTFFIPGTEEKNEKQLNVLVAQLRDKLAALIEEQKKAVAKILNNIAYLFKTADYRYEHEVRLVVQGVGFKKEITGATPPRVYIELVKLAPSLSKIILGPKVERADEWAAAFNYHIKKEYPIRTQPVEIKISHLPFK